MDIAHYIKQYKKHEQDRVSTNERNEYWRKYDELDKKQTN
jgi:hypothetical protein